MVTRTQPTPSGAKTSREGSAAASAKNAIADGRGRNRSSRTERRTDAAAGASPARSGADNSIQPVKRRAKIVDAKPRPRRSPDALRDADGQAPTRDEGKQHASGAQAPSERQRSVPEHVRKRFVQVGKHYYFADGARAFTDRGGRLTTPSENTEVIQIGRAHV